MNDEQAEWKLYFVRILFGNFAAVSHVDHSTPRSLSKYDVHQIEGRSDSATQQEE